MTSNDSHYELKLRTLANNLFGVAQLSFDCLAWCVDTTVRFAIACVENELVLMTLILSALFILVKFGQHH